MRSAGAVDNKSETDEEVTYDLAGSRGCHRVSETDRIGVYYGLIRRRKVSTSTLERQYKKE